jgi:dolichyl-phosphate beta-glucosyltransferase
MLRRQKDISIVIPAYNEAEKIGAALSAIQELLCRQNRWQTYEVIVAADGCTDRTMEIVTQRCRTFPQLRIVSYKKNQGKGCAVKTGVAITSGALVVFMDADLSTPATELLRLAEPIENKTADLVIGSRRMADSNILIRQPWHRRVMGLCLSLFTRMDLGLRLFDTQCGFKLFNGKVARSLFADMNCPHFGFDLELLYRARRRRYRILEMGVSWRDNPSSSVRPIRDSIRVLAFACKLRLLPLSFKKKYIFRRNSFNGLSGLTIYPDSHHAK